MSKLTLNDIVDGSSSETLQEVFAYVARKLISNAGEAGELTDLPIRDPETGDLIGWLRSLQNEIARIESTPGFRDALRESVESGLKDISDTRFMRRMSSQP